MTRGLGDGTVDKGLGARIKGSTFVMTWRPESNCSVRIVLIVLLVFIVLIVFIVFIVFTLCT